MNYSALRLKLHRSHLISSLCGLLIVGSLYWAIPPVAALVSALTSYPVFDGTGSPSAPPFGTQDFIQYWIAAQLASQGLNFYDPSEMLRAQRAILGPDIAPLMMWNPPWNVFLFWPLRFFAFETAAWIFLWINFLALLGSLVLLIRGYERCLGQSARRGEVVLLIALTFSFVPVWTAFSLGQVGILLLLACSSAFYFLSRKRYSRAGACLALASIKPHLTLLLVLAAVWWSLRSKNWRVIGAYVVSLFGLAVASLLYTPNALFDWLHALFFAGPSELVPQVHEWKVASLAFAAKYAASLLNLPTPARAPFFLSAATAALFFFYLVRRERRFSWTLEFAPILTLSVITAPVAWVSDQTLLLPLVVGVVLLSSTKDGQKAAELILALSSLIFITAWLRASYLTRHEQFWWLGVPFLVLWLSAAWERPNGRSPAPADK